MALIKNSPQTGTNSAAATPARSGRSQTWREPLRFWAGVGGLYLLAIGMGMGSSRLSDQWSGWVYWGGCVVAVYAVARTGARLGAEAGSAVAFKRGLRKDGPEAFILAAWPQGEPLIRARCPGIGPDTKLADDPTARTYLRAVARHLELRARRKLLLSCPVMVILVVGIVWLMPNGVSLWVTLASAVGSLALSFAYQNLSEEGQGLMGAAMDLKSEIGF